MKKFLSVALALAMTLSLVVVGASAKSFTDSSKVTYKEAVDVISSCKVIDGYTDGSFAPTNTLTRGAAAKIICNMVLGPTTANALGVSTAPFKDVSTSNVFAGYIAYCAKQGIINGYTDKTFRPAGTVTGYQFLKMLLGALGYDGTIEGFSGSNWEVNVAKLASNLGLYTGNDKFVGTKAMTREEACLYAFNTLRATMVDYATKGTNITINGITIAQGASKAAAVKIADTTYADKNGNNTLQFFEKYFQALSFDTTYAQGKVTRTVSYNGKTIATTGSVGKVLATSADGTSFADLQNAGKSSYVGYKPDTDGVTYYYQDAAASTSYPATTTVAANETTIQSKLATVGVVANFIDTDNDGTYNVVSVVEKNVVMLSAAPTTKTSGTLTYVTVPGVASSRLSTAISYPDGLVKGDVVLYYTSQNGMIYVEKATKVDGDKITAYNDTNEAVTINGKTYGSSGVTTQPTAYDTYAKLKALIGQSGFAFYTDNGGNICYTVAPSNTVSLTNTLFVTATNATTSFGSSTYQAKVTYMDGKTDTLTIAKTATNAGTMTDVNDKEAASMADGKLNSHLFYTYTKNSDNTYNLRVANTQVGGALDLTKGSSNTTLDSGDISYTVTAKTAQFLGKSTYTTAWGTPVTEAGVYGTNSTVFMYKDSSTGAYNVYTGVNNAQNYAAGGSVYVLKDSYNYALAVICMGGSSSTSATSYDKVFVNSAATTTLDADNVHVYTYTATVNGETGKSVSSYVELTKGNLYFVKDYNKAGVINAASDVATMGTTVAVTDADVQAVAYNNGVLMVDGVAYLMSNDAKVYLYDSSSASIITPEQATALEYNATESQAKPDSVTVVKTSSSDQSVAAVYIYIQK